MTSRNSRFKITGEMCNELLDPGAAMDPITLAAMDKLSQGGPGQADFSPDILKKGNERLRV
jgi:hypothetical protein